MLGKYIHQIRKTQGFTLSQLAKRVGISKSYLSNIERELKRNPSIQIMERLAAALNMDLNDLLQNGTDQVRAQYLDQEWVDFMNEFKSTGIHKEQIQEYRILIAFMKWHNDKRRQSKSKKSSRK